MRLGTGTELGSFLASVLALSAFEAPKYGFSIDATAYGEIDPGSYDHKSRLNGSEESILTSCSTLFESGKPATFSYPKGDPSPTCFAIDSTLKH